MNLPTGNIGDSLHGGSSQGAVSPRPVLAETVPEKAFSFAQTLSFWYVKLFLVLSSLSLVIVSSMVFYWLVYFLLIPPKLYTYPANLKGDCFNVTLANRQWVSDFRPLTWDRPTASIEFDVSLMLKVPMVSPSDHREQSSINATLLTASGAALADFQTQWLPPQLSNWAFFLRNMAYSVPSALGLVYETWEAELPLFLSFPLLMEEGNDPLSYVSVCMHPRPQFYYSELRFHSKLSGLRYLLSTYPVGSFLVFTTLTTALFTVFAASAGAALLLIGNLRRKKTRDDDADSVDSDDSQE
jgi:Putative adipose-regulatory protein (Seipin)